MYQVKRQRRWRAQRRPARTYVVLAPNKINSDEPVIAGLVHAASQRAAMTAARLKWGTRLPEGAVARAASHVAAEVYDDAIECEAIEGEDDPVGCMPEWEAFLNGDVESAPQ